MGCSQPKLSRTGLRNILAFLKVELQHFLGGTRALLRFAEGRGLKDDPGEQLCNGTLGRLTPFGREAAGGSGSRQGRAEHRKLCVCVCR